MSEEPVEGLRPDEGFEIVDVDLTPVLTGEQKSWPVGVGRRPEEEFALEEPLPALDVRVSGGAAPAEGRLPALVDVLSDQEVALGGSGLDVSRKKIERGGACVTLVPKLADGARARLERMAKWATQLGPEIAVTVV